MKEIKVFKCPISQEIHTDILSNFRLFQIKCNYRQVKDFTISWSQIKNKNRGFNFQTSKEQNIESENFLSTDLR